MELTVSHYKFSQLNLSRIFSSFMSQSGCINLGIAILGDFLKLGRFHFTRRRRLHGGAWLCEKMFFI